MGADPGDEDVQPAELLAFLEMSLRQGVTEGKYRAIALFVDVRVEVPGQVEKTDAVQAGLEHRTGYCVDVFLPYEKQEDDLGRLWGSLCGPEAEQCVHLLPSELTARRDREKKNDRGGGTRPPRSGLEAQLRRLGLSQLDGPSHEQDQHGSQLPQTESGREGDHRLN